MRAPYTSRVPRQSPREDLILLRKKLYPKVMQRDFASLLGVTRLHLTQVEMGRRTPSLELALRWLKALRPEANLDMFGAMPKRTEQRIRAALELEELQKQHRLSPKNLKAA